MTWTNKKPTEEGWYWYAQAGNEAVVVHVVTNQTGKLVAKFPGLVEGYPLAPDPDGRWMGPLERPVLKASS